MSITDDRDVDRPRSNWEVDEWDEVGEVLAVEPTRRQTRLVKWIVWAGFALLTVVIIVAGWIGWWYIGMVNPDGDPGPSVPFTVLETDDLDSLSSRLEADGLIVDADVFEWYVDEKGGLEIVPGYYQLPTNDHVGNVLARLRTPPDQTYQRVTFPEGLTVDQMGLRLEETMPRLRRGAFVAATEDGTADSAIERPPGVTSMEGLLFPDTYQVSNADNEAQVVERMAALMERVAIDQEDLVERAAQLGRTPYEIMIIASMIEREAKLDEDRAKIASVIYNRLYIGMNLQIDATLYYQADSDTPFPELRAIDSPYNTYMHPGLPPTPIANPGRASIRAALNPAPNPPPGDPLCQDLDDPTVACIYLYYVLADADGGHAFAVTGEQHQANVNAAAAAGLLD